MNKGKLLKGSMMLQWPKKAKVEHGVTKRRIWRSKCCRYRVVHSHCEYGDKDSLADVWYAMVFDAMNHMWDIISRHRKRQPAFKACETHARRYT